MERVEKLENSTEESLGIEETVCMKSVVRNWRDPTHHRKVKRKRISLRNRISDGSQGSVISPLLANIYLNTLDRLWEKYGLTHGILVRYADDTVIICKNKKSANHALNLLRYIMAKLNLKLHPVKTKIISMWDGKEGFDFLGMHHRRMTTETRKGQLYKETYQYPSRKAMKKMKAEDKRNVSRRSLLVAKEEDLIKNLNPKITGWKNYYSTKRNEKWMQALDWYIICTFTRWYNKKHQRRNRMSKVGFVRNSIYEKGLKKMARA